MHAAIFAPPAGFDFKAAHVAAQWPCEKPLICCRIDPKVEFVLAGGEWATPERVKIVDGSKTRLEGGHDSWIFDAAWAPDATRCVTAGGDGRLVWWDLSSDKPAILHRIDAHNGWIRALSVSPDGTTLASGGNDGLVKLWNLADAKPLRTIEASKRNIYRTTFSPDGKQIASGDLIGAVVSWNVVDGKETARYEGKPLHEFNGGQQVDFGGVRALAYTTDGKRLAAGGLHKGTNPLGAVHEPLGLVFESDTKKMIRQWTANNVPGGVYWSFRWLADGTMMGASGGSSGGMLLFHSMDAEKEVHRLALPNILRDMDLATDGLTVATAHHDRHVRITRLAAKQA